MAKPFTRGQCVEFTIDALSGIPIRGQIVQPASTAGAWIILGTDGTPYEQPASALRRLSGKTARETKRASDLLLIRRDIARELTELLDPPVYVPKATTVAPDRKRRTGGWDGMPGYGEKPDDRRRAGLVRSDIPTAICDLDRPIADGGLDWTPQMARYMDWSTGPEMVALKALYDIDPRMKAVYILCVDQGRSPLAVALELGCSRITVWRLRKEAERIMSSRRHRTVTA